MAFKIDGSVHYSGIANEGKTAEILNNIEYFPDKVETRGGTKHKEDAVAGSFKLSAKDKKRLSAGSFERNDVFFFYLGICNDWILQSNMNIFSIAWKRIN